MWQNPLVPAQPVRRSYDASRRREAAARNRVAVLSACRDLLVAQGYQATTIRTVASAAGVSPEMIYKTFGSKQGLMKAVYDLALAGDDEPVPIGERPAVREILAMSDARAKVRAYAGFVRGLMERLGGLAAVLAESDPEVADVRATTEDERLHGVRAFVDHLASAGQLAAGVEPRAAADACWVLTSPTVFAQLTVSRQWDGRVYEQWLASMLTATLLTSP